MWPFGRRKKAVSQPAPIEEMSFTQVDTTDHFEDNRSVGTDEWISTSPLNKLVEHPERAGLPPVGASADAVYAIASRLSEIRESLPIPGDGVYCPVCHIASTDLDRLRTPCPKCGRDLLKFGWA